MKKLELTDEHREFLEELRKSGVTNMWGAAPFMAARFKICEDCAGKLLVLWIKEKKAQS